MRNRLATVAMRWWGEFVVALSNGTVTALFIFGLLLACAWPAHSSDLIPISGLDRNKSLTFGRSPLVANSEQHAVLTVSAKSQESFKQASTIFGNGFEGGSGGGPPPFSCVDPMVRPVGMTGRIIPWSKMFSPPDGAPVPTYPDGLGFPVPIGSNKGSWTSGEFIAQPGQTINFTFERAQAKPNEGYFRARVALTMLVTISPCAGDVRAPVFGATDYLAPGCRRYASAGTLVQSTKFGPDSTFAYCALVPGQKYYYTVSPIDPRDGYTLGEHTCSTAEASAQGCDVQARHAVQ